MKRFLIVLEIFVLCTLTQLDGATIPKPIGVHFDIEPHTLSEWQADYNSIANQFLDLLDQVRPLLQARDLKFTVDIPFWYDSRDVTRGSAAARPFHELILDRVDRVGVMAYRDFATVRDLELYVPVMSFEDDTSVPSILQTFVSPVFDMYNEMYSRIENFLGLVDQKNRTDGIVKLSEMEMIYANLTTKEVTVMIETKCQNMDNFITFCAYGSPYMEKQMKIIKDSYKNNSAYDRIGIHQVEYWMQMEPEPIKRECSNLRDVYQWGTSALFEPVTRNKTIEFYKDHAVRTIYVDADYAVRRNQTALVDYLVLTGEYNLQTEMLFGKSVWAKTENHTNVLSLLDTLFDFLDSHTLFEIPDDGCEGKF